VLLLSQEDLSTLTVPAGPGLLRCGCWLEICITPWTEITLRACRLESQPSVDSFQQRWRYRFDDSRFMYILMSGILLNRELRDHAGFLVRDRHCTWTTASCTLRRSQRARGSVVLYHAVRAIVLSTSSQVEINRWSILGRDTDRRLIWAKLRLHSARSP
jgi:hypothetical protein